MNSFLNEDPEPSAMLFGADIAAPLAVQQSDTISFFRDFRRHLKVRQQFELTIAKSSNLEI